MGGGNLRSECTGRGHHLNQERAAQGETRELKGNRRQDPPMNTMTVQDPLACHDPASRLLILMAVLSSG